MTGAGKPLAAIAALMGAAGVVLAALSAHEPDAARLGSASSMLLFHAVVIIGTVLLVNGGFAQRHIGLTAALAFVAGAGLFAGDLVLRQFAGQGVFPMAAPTGGTLMILGWLALAIAAAWPSKAA
ncbi:DUF423 domain-containing protein [Bradyrhizobium sp. U87765 SZCCT0131]|uniref:DUF423 domain-containing protein n=1 Tax=unclassified Bradyrhizobium TaxID=2631580 RepID=UPI001BAAF74D|nr:MULTISPECIES: DUF423 domain-containing protein [unclassified Bradyrhizobium]MBR1217414.1 DUF423 domain-containing protein [Bradyrhizobium sp. U87765 SZCCT0131]MBR1264989.1 DUF423 domain-containing protein [Bradyrhizobium sp. U87765 SZCCT0134]MBR1304971.1 DUF423 domain-containing protein [Bradyrhizobium sp. U87765 SZCCT0110]MBR1320757.1 DUF423 domain-containing protein [Bradyrhizobium sp. U87765 SZCCT0109]MBR1349177.1 DUF423 domain-containing protein [Bradyrhizobium sp. U87765 SZCCT0048]